MMTRAEPDAGVGRATGSQTLSRGLSVLETLADATGPLRIDALAERIGVHRSIAYRLVRTLEDHRLVQRTDSGAVALAPRLAALGRAVAGDLQAVALPELTAAANELAATCFLVVLDRDECVTLVSAEPRHAAAIVAQRPGARHSALLGAPGRVVLGQLPVALRPAMSAAAAAVVEAAAADGWSSSHDEVIPGLHAIAVPLVLPGRAPAAVALVAITPPEEPAAVARRLSVAAAAIGDAVAH